jgi:hypothetical protein
MQQMTSLGDLASSTGKDFDQLVEAMIDAQTGEFERLKDFGIRAEKNGKKVNMLFKGVTTEIEFSNEAIRKYILGLGEAEGVTGSMVKISETLGGKTNNLKDSWNSMLETMGNSSKNVFTGVISMLDSMIRGFDTAMKSMEQIQKEARVKVMDTASVEDVKEVEFMMSRGMNQDKAVNTFISELEGTLKTQQERLAKASDEKNIRYGSSQAVVFLQKMGILNTSSDKQDIDSSIKLIEGRIEALKAHFAPKKDTKTDPDPKGPKTDGSMDAGLSSVTGDNRTVRNININIGKQIENLYIQSQTMEQGADQFAENLKRVLLTAVNDANLIAS